MDCDIVTKGYDHVSKMESSELLTGFALHVFVPVLVGTSVYRYTANEFVGALWGSSALLTTIMLRQLSTMPQTQVNPPPQGGQKNSGTPVNSPSNTPQSTATTTALELLNREILDLSETKLNQLWLDKISKEEFDRLQKSLTSRLTSLSPSVKVSNDIQKMTELKNRLACVKEEYNAYIDPYTKTLRKDLQKDYIPIKIDDNGNCIFLSIALAKDPELQKFAKKLFLWIEQ
ncbi:MAG: hypothetical protein JSR80_01115, partial [Verrucomicrobia bacterium]|nr:hypothetical protein [Verrucomicrobiota bacterium]